MGITSLIYYIMYNYKVVYCKSFFLSLNILIPECLAQCCVNNGFQFYHPTSSFWMDNVSDIEFASLRLCVVILKVTLSFC